MRDPGTRHQFDVRKERVEAEVAGGLEVVEGHPVHDGPNGRPGKPYQELRAEAKREAEAFGAPLPPEFADEDQEPDSAPEVKQPAAQPATPKKRSEKR